MALKLKITAAEFDKLSDGIKSEYIDNGDGTYRLDTDVEDTGALKRAKDREAQLRKDAEKKARELEERLAALEGDDARKKGDIDTLEKAWKEKADREKADLQAVIDRHQNYISKTLVDNVASSLAAEISTAPKLLAPHIRARLQADLSGDTPMTKVLDNNGKVSELSLEQLREEITNNADFATIIKGSKSSGGGAADGRGGAARKTSSHPEAPLDLSKAKAADLVAAIEARKAEQ